LTSCVPFKETPAAPILVTGLIGQNRRETILLNVAGGISGR
jgi:hypothetical protein